MTALSARIKSIKKASTLLVTPKVEEFLLREPEGVIWDDAGFDLFKGIVKRAGGNEDRSARFGASSRGKCHRQQVFTFLGMPSLRLREPETQNLFNDGKWRHLRWQMMGVQSGALTHAEWPAAWKKYRVTTSLDGLNNEEGFGFELKGDRWWQRVMEGVPEAHLLQIHTMFGATGYDRFVYIVESKSSQEWREIVVYKDPVMMRAVKDELEQMNDYVEDHRLPEVLPACSQKEGPYKQCAFAAQCLERRDEYGDDWPVQPGDWSS